MNIKQKLIIFDLNGTLTNTPFIDKAPLALLPGRKEMIESLHQAGKICAIASNQGGVAFGFTTELAAVEEIEDIGNQLGIDEEFCEVAFGHPNPKYGYEEYANQYHLGRRKPGPNMLISLKEKTGCALEEILMVGDREEDQGAAEAAGVAFCWTKDFFADPAELVARIYTRYQQVLESTGNRALTLHFFHDGSGAITDLVCWDSLPEAIEKINAACQAERA